MVGVIFAVVLAVGITIAGYSVFLDMSARSREVNREVAHGDPTFHLGVNGSDYHIDYEFNMTAKAVFPRAVVEGTIDFNLNVSFVIMLPANASYYSGYLVEAYLSSGPIVSGFPTGGLALGGYDPYPDNSGVLVKGEPMGETGIGFWNVTVYMTAALPHGLNLPQNQSWLSFTNQAETHLFIFLHGNGNMTAANGTKYTYTLLTLFNFQGNPTIFYRFSYPVVAWLGYGSSILIAVASLYRLIHTTRGKHAKEEARTRLDSGV